MGDGHIPGTSCQCGREASGCDEGGGPPGAHGGAGGGLDPRGLSLCLCVHPAPGAGVSHPPPPTASLPCCLKVRGGSKHTQPGKAGPGQLHDDETCTPKTGRLDDWQPRGSGKPARAACPSEVPTACGGRGGRDKRSRGVGVSAEHSLRPRPCPRPRQPTSPGLGPWAWGAGDHALRKPLLLPGGDRSGRAGAAGEAIVSGLETAYGFCFKTSKLLPCEKRLHKSPPQVPPGGGPGLGRKPWPGAELWERGGRGGPVGSAQGAGRGWGARRPPRVWAPGPSLPGAVVLQLWTQVLVTVDQGPREESGVMWPTGL